MPKLDCTKRSAKINLLDKSSRTKWEFADAVDCDSTLNVDGAATLASTLAVTGATTFSSTITCGLGKLANNTIADPGNTTKAIPVTASGICEIVTTGAETRTIAAPTFAGQVIVINMITDGGDCVITASAAINATGNNTMTFGEVGDVIGLVGRKTAATPTYTWAVLFNDGVALSTV